MKINSSLGERIFDAFNIIILSLAGMAVIIPMLHVLAGSFSSQNALIYGDVYLWPVDFNLKNYALVFQNDIFWKAFGVTLFIVIVGTLINIVLTVLTAYPLSKKDLKWRKSIVLFIVFTMIFQAPLIPTYLLVNAFGLVNSLWALILIPALNAFNLILCITFFRSLSEELIEAAKVDGMSEYAIVWRIVVPLSLPIIVTLLLFYAVSHWNNYFLPLVYITDADLRPLQLYLYYLVAESNMEDTLALAVESASDISPVGIQMATIIVATVPILIIYPFIQKHFVKGALLGSLKE